MGRFKCVDVLTLVLALSTQVSNVRGEVESNNNADRSGKIEGRYTRDIDVYELVIPRKVDANGTFSTYTIPHFYERRHEGARRRRHANETADADADVDVDADERLFYALTFDGALHHLELVPNHNFLSPGLVVETRSARSLGKTKLRRVRQPQCHYTGWVRGQDGSRAALSVCDGLVGYIRTSSGHFFIEPAKGRGPRDDGQHLHLVYRNDRNADGIRPPPANCNVTGWERAWEDRMRRQLREGKPLRVPSASKRSISRHRFIEAMVVADRKFIQHHNNTDVETYILTIMNMVSDYYHDSSIGNQIEFVVVRIVFLEKEKEEIDLTISPNAEKTLDSFCDWQMKVNPNVSHPSHHDVAILLTRYDICSDNMSNCGLLGLARMASACLPNLSCCINEDQGLNLAITVTHEVGHVMGCGHDDEESGCDPEAEDKSYFVMSPYLKFHTTRWSSCSRKFVTEFLDGGLGECLLDEPQDQNFDTPEMPVGAMYDAAFQCELIFGESVKPCKTGTDTFCQTLWCQTEPTTCSSDGNPAADGTSCGNNMWCYDERCVEIGERPGAVDGGWGPYGAWSDCSRTCGGGVRFQERFCDNPAPQNRGRYCLGKRKQYQTCNTSPCGVNNTPFREQQCTDFNKKKFHGQLHIWKPYKPKGNFNPCALICINEAHVYSTLAPRVKDGTKCRPGSKDLCIAGMCTKVGCDWQIDSDAIDDQCGICRGDGTQCVLIEGLFNQTSGNGYVEIVTIPKGARNIKIEELKPVANSLAVSSASSDKKQFYLNGDNKEVEDGEYRFGTAIGVYSHPEVEREELEIAGPTSEDLVIYVVFYSNNDNPGVWYKYFVPSANSSYLPKYNWEFLDWGLCSTRCGAGSQISESSCVESRTGKVSNTFCHQSDRPHPKSRVCNLRPCQTRWKTGAWSACEGKNGKGLMHRKVACVRESAHADEPDIEVPVDACKETKPRHSKECDLLEDATSKREVSPPFVDTAKHAFGTNGPRKRAKHHCDYDEHAVRKKGLTKSSKHHCDDDKHVVGHKGSRKRVKQHCDIDEPRQEECDLLEGEASKCNASPPAVDAGKDAVGAKASYKRGQCDNENQKKVKECDDDRKKENTCDSKPKKEKTCDSEPRKEKTCEKKVEKEEYVSCTNKPKKEKTCDNEERCEEDKLKSCITANKPVDDRVCPNEIVLMEASVVKTKPQNSTTNSTCLNDGKEGADIDKGLSDQAMEELGDKVPELTLDLKNELVVKGEKAVKRYKKMRQQSKKTNCQLTKRDDKD